MAAAALPAMAAASQATHAAGGVVAEVARVLSKPIYEDTRTTVRTWSQADKHGRIQNFTETHSKGYTVPLGLVVGTAAVVLAWEVGLSFSKALGGKNGVVLQDAVEVLAAPAFIAYDATGAVIAWANGYANGIIADIWTWVGDGKKHSAPPAQTTRTAVVPATAMAGINSALVGVLTPVSAASNGIGAQLAAAIASATGSG